MEQICLEFVSDFEDVARMLFSPLFICDGILSQKAFTLDVISNESYIDEVLKLYTVCILAVYSLYSA